jgi:hypothetical protein
MVEPVNGKNPLVQQAHSIHLPMPGEEPGEDDGYEDDDEWEELPEMDSEPLRDPLSEDEQFEGVNRPPPDLEKARKRHRRPPMPKVPKPREAPVFIPPFEVLPDGSVTGPKIGDGSDVLPPGFDPPKGSAEAAAQVLYGRPPQQSGGNG